MTGHEESQLAAAETRARKAADHLYWLMREPSVVLAEIVAAKDVRDDLEGAWWELRAQFLASPAPEIPGRQQARQIRAAANRVGRGR